MLQRRLVVSRDYSLGAGIGSGRDNTVVGTLLLQGPLFHVFCFCCETLFNTFTMEMAKEHSWGVPSACYVLVTWCLNLKFFYTSWHFYFQMKYSKRSL